MIGMDAASGRALGGEAHLRQSLLMLLQTPPATRTGRLEYGCDLLGLLDSPGAEERFPAIYAAAVEAIETWEPRITVQEIHAELVEDGARIELVARRTDADETLQITLDLSRRAVGPGFGPGFG